jgi:hypothetical protein
MQPYSANNTAPIILAGPASLTASSKRGCGSRRRLLRREPPPARRCCIQPFWEAAIRITGWESRSIRAAHLRYRLYEFLRLSAHCGGNSDCGGGRIRCCGDKLTSAGTLVYSTFIGGSGDDHGRAIAVDWIGECVYNRRYARHDRRAHGAPEPYSVLAITGSEQDVLPNRLILQ